MIRYSILFFLLVGNSFASSAQATKSNPVEYMQQLNDREQMLSKNYLSYMSEVAHGRNARKMEKRRVELVNAIKAAISEASKKRPFNGDASLRDAYKVYWGVLLSVFTEDYAKIVDMEEVAERSYDAMEAYLLIQERAGEKLDEASKQVTQAYEAFASNNKVLLLEGQTSKLNAKLQTVGKVNTYTKTLYLIYFKSSVQETLLSEALAKQDLNAVEQTRGSLLKYSIEGLSILDTLKPFRNDGSLLVACRKVLEFQKDEAENKVKVLTGFAIKSDDFQKLKKSFESKPANKRTQAEIDNFNKGVDEQNKAVAAYNKTANELNNGRLKVMNNWDNTWRRFLDNHVPKA